MVHKHKEKIEDICVGFFSSLFSTSRPSNIYEALKGIYPKVDDDMNMELIQKVTAEEIYRAMKQMNPNKAPDPDGMTAGFYQIF